MLFVQCSLPTLSAYCFAEFPILSSPTNLHKAALNSLQLRLIATVASEVLASPLPNLAIPKAPRGSFGSVPSRKGLATEDTAWGQEEIGPTAMRGMPPWRVGMSASPSPTVSEAWASKRHADWETLEVLNRVYAIGAACTSIRGIEMTQHVWLPTYVGAH